MTDREALTILIREKGACKITVRCSSCPFSGPTFYCNDREYRYKRAVKWYLELYGQEDLVELLI